MSLWSVYETDGGVTCPKCAQHWDRDDLWHRFQANDYSTTFEIEHEGCDKRLEILVESDPVFSRTREPGEPRRLRSAGREAS